jgi:ParB/RepB/Spo0J family partition protein
MTQQTPVERAWPNARVVDPSLLGSSPTNPRRSFDPDKLAELAESLRQVGLVQPLVIRLWPAEYPKPNANIVYEVVSGERRLRAARAAKLDFLPVIERDFSTPEVLKIQLIENLQREDLDPLDEADGYRRMMDDYGLSADALAKEIGKSKSYIYGRVKLASLCSRVREAVRDGSSDCPKCSVSSDSKKPPSTARSRPANFPRRSNSVASRAGSPPTSSAGFARLPPSVPYHAAVGSAITVAPALSRSR